MWLASYSLTWARIRRIVGLESSKCTCSSSRWPLECLSSSRVSPILADFCPSSLRTRLARPDAASRLSLHTRSTPRSPPNSPAPSCNVRVSPSTHPSLSTLRTSANNPCRLDSTQGRCRFCSKSKALPLFTLYTTIIYFTSIFSNWFNLLTICCIFTWVTTPCPMMNTRNIRIKYLSWFNFVRLMRLW